MFLRFLLILPFCLFCVNIYAEKAERESTLEQQKQRRINSKTTYVDGAGLAHTVGPPLNIAKREAHPGDIIFPADKNFLDLSLKERFRVLYKRRVSYDEYSAPKYAKPKYGSFYYEGNPLRPDPKIEKEIIAKLRLIRLFCDSFREKIPVATMQENAEMASALIADYLSEDEWGQARIVVEEFKLRSQNFSEAYVTNQLQRRKNFYARRLRRIRDSNNMTTLLSGSCDFVYLLIRAFPDDMDKAVELYEKSLIPQKTSFGKMSERYRREHTRNSENIPPQYLDCYNAILEVEARRERKLTY